LPRVQKALLPSCSLAVAIGFFWFFAARGLDAGFTTDDLANMNMYEGLSGGALIRANLLFFSPFYRPAGAIFYRPLFALFGLSPHPFRVACLVLLSLNLLLAWFFVRSLTESSGIAALTALIAAFHPRLAPLYWNTGVIYDILCFASFYTALTVYLRLRRRRRAPRTWEWLGVLVPYVCALDAKEIAVALPPVLLTWELIYDPPISWRITELGPWLWRNARLPLAAGLITVPYICGKLLPESPLRQLDRYSPQISLHQFLATYGAYCDDVFFLAGWFTPGRTAFVLLGLLLLALCLKKRALLFGWCLGIIASLPIAFIPYRNAAEYYIPMIGWSLYAASLIAVVTTEILRNVRLARTPSLGHAAMFLLTLCLLLRAYRVQALRMGGPSLLGQQAIQAMVAEFDRHAVKLPTHARGITIQDPFSPDYETLLLLRLYAHDPTLQLDYARADDCRHDFALQWIDRSLVDFRPPQAEQEWCRSSAVLRSSTYGSLVTRHE
jgi:hypothetical protein